MPGPRGQVALLGLVVLAGLAGCPALVGTDASGESTPTPTLTPAPVPGPGTTTATDRPGTQSERAPATRTTVTPSGAAGLVVNGSGTGQPRYFSLRPTCERPPGLVVHIQVAALANDNGTDAGINATWRFASPSNRQSIGSYRTFVDLIDRRYRPLLDARTVTYYPVELTGRNATRQVTVRTGDGLSATYVWLLRRQTGGRYDGCWMTEGVVGPIGSPA